MELLVERPHHFKYFFGYDPDLEQVDIIYGIVERYDMRYFPDIEFDRDWIERETRYYTIKYVRTDENNDTAHERMYVDLKNFMNQFKDSEKTPISKIEFINAYPNKKIIFDPGVFKVMTDYCKNIEIDIGRSYFRMEETEYKELAKLSIESGNILIDGNVTLKTQIFRVYESNIENYNKTEYNAHFNVIAYNELNISEVLKVYSTVKVKFLCEAKSRRAYKNSVCRINDIQFYGNEMSKEDYKEERLKIQGFARCSLIYLTIAEDVRYPSLLKVDKLEYFSLFGLEYTISKRSAEGNIITIGDVAKVSLYEIAFEVDDGTFDVGFTEVNLVKLLPCEVNFARKVLINECDIINYDKNSLINLVYIMKSNIKQLKVNTCSMTSGTCFYKADDDVSVEKLSYAECTFENDVDVTIKNAGYISLTENDFDLKGGSLSLLDCTYLVLSDNVIRGKDLVIKGNQRRISIHDNEILFDSFSAICTYVPKVDEDKLTYNVVFNNSVLQFKKSFVIDGFGCRVLEGMLKCPSISVKSNVITKFDNVTFTNDSSFQDIKFDIHSSLFIASTFVRGDDALLLNLLFNIISEDDSYLNKLSIENGNIFKGNLGIDITTNVPFKAKINNNAISVKYTDDFIGYKSYVSFYDPEAYIINNSEKICECKKLNDVDDNGCYKHEITVRE